MMSFEKKEQKELETDRKSPFGSDFDSSGITHDGFGTASQSGLSKSPSPSPHYRLFHSSSVGRSTSAADFLPSRLSQSSEAKAIDRMFEDLSQYESTVSRLSSVNLNDRFKEELEASGNWFASLTEYERMTVIYSFLPFLNSMQKRFFTTVLNQQLGPESLCKLPSSKAEPFASYSGSSSAFNADDSASGCQINFPMRPSSRLFRSSFHEHRPGSAKHRECDALSLPAEKVLDAPADPVGTPPKSASGAMHCPIPTRNILSSGSNLLTLNGLAASTVIQRPGTPVNGQSSSTVFPCAPDPSCKSARNTSSLMSSPMKSTSTSDSIGSSKMTLSYASAAANTGFLKYESIFSASSNSSFDLSTPSGFSKSPSNDILTPVSGTKSLEKLPLKVEKEESSHFELLEGSLFLTV
jgi:hypothetical protein